MDIETKTTTIATIVWDIWTGNGRDMDQDEREQTGKAALEAVQGCYVDGISDRDWQVTSLTRLGCDLAGTVFDKEG